MPLKVRSVLGDLEPASLGRTYTHEHLSMHFGWCYVEPPIASGDKSQCQWELKNRGWIQQYPYSHRDNLILDDPEAEESVVESVREFKKNGGGCLVENSTVGIGRNNTFVKKVSHETGVHIVCGTGYYVKDSQKDDILKITTEEMSNHMIKELTEGCEDDPSVKCGFIGEVGCYYPLYDFEKNSIRAAAEAQKATGSIVSFHPGRDHQAPFEIIRLFTEAGGDPKRVIMSHLDRTILNNDILVEFGNEFGSYLQFDLFGIEVSNYQIKESVDFPSDAQRIDYIKHLIDNGFEDRILVAHDIHTKHRLEKFGGHGFSHFLLTGVPKMLIKGITQEQVDKILINNPSAALAYEM